MTDLGTLDGNYGSANDINASGQVTGESRNPGGDYHAFITGSDGAGMTDLGTLGGSSSSGNAINDGEWVRQVPKQREANRMRLSLAPMVPD